MQKGELPYSFLLTEDFLSQSDGAYSVTDLDGGYFLRFLKTFKPQDFSVLCQERYPDLLATVFTENGVKISIETENGFFAEELQCLPSSAKIDRFYLSDSRFLAVELAEQSEKYFAVYDLNKDVKRLLFERISDYSVSEGLWAEKPFFDTLKHKVKSYYIYRDGELIETNKEISTGKKLNLDATPDPIIPYLFLEELLVGGEVTLYLDESLQSQKHKITGYFGNFLGTMPPPVFRDINDVGLVYKKSDNLYFVKYARFDITAKKITNFRLN